VADLQKSRIALFDGVKRLVAELSLDKAILQDINAKKWTGPR